MVISNSNGNSAIDSEQGYSYTGGSVVAIMPRGGMSSEATHCQNFSSIGESNQAALSASDYLTIEIGDVTATIKMPSSMSAIIVVLGDSSPDIDTDDSTDKELDQNGVIWY